MAYSVDFAEVMKGVTDEISRLKHERELLIASLQKMGAMVEHDETGHKVLQGRAREGGMTLSVEVKAKFNSDAGHLELETYTTGIADARDFLSRHVVELQDKAVRNALIEMGWTPPGEEEDQ
jgi:hypothetical protein